MFLTVVVFILVLGLLILVHELGHFIVAKKSGVYVEEFAIGFPPRIWSVKKGETVYSINALPFGGFVKMKGELEESQDPRGFSKQSKLKRFGISVAGVFMNLVLAWLILAAGFMVGMAPIISPADQVPGEKIDSEILVAETYKDSAASQLGLLQGDQINYVLVGGEKYFIDQLDSLGDITKSNLGSKLTVNYSREGEEKEGSVTLSDDPNAPLGVVVVERSVVRVPWYSAFYVALRETYEIAKFTLIFLGDFFAGLLTKGQIAEGVGGPVAIYLYTGMAVKAGFVTLMQFVAILSINLALVNILPFPGLDGGRILFIALESLFGKKVVKDRIENMIHLIGLALVVVLFIALTYKDIVRLISK